MNFVGIIPARFQSSRLPGKPLKKIGSKTMIQRVYKQVNQALDTVIVATDDERIYKEVTNFGGKCVITSTEHESGSDRCAEAIEIIEKEHVKNFDVVINIQGDEPFINPGQIDKLKSCFTDRTTQIATLAKKINKTDELFEANIVKVVIAKNRQALYFSRSAIPHFRNQPAKNWIKQHDYFKHLGIYAYKRDILPELTQLPVSLLEKTESLEQLRWLENGYKITVAVTNKESLSVDTPDDLKRANEYLNSIS